MYAGFIQSQPKFGDIQYNVEHLCNLISKTHADLLVLPELCTTGYFFASGKQSAALAEQIPGGYACKAFSELAKRKKMYFVAGIAEKSGNKTYNSAVLFGPSGVMSVYRKLHLYKYEKKWFDSGNLPLKVNKIKGAKVAMMICFDYFFPEAMRKLALQGADIICHPAALVLPYCQDAMRTRCLENGVYAITANRIGTEKSGGGVVAQFRRRKNDSLTFTGQSQLTGTRGEILYRAGANAETIKVIKIDPKLSRNKNLNPYNNLFHDRRPKYYN